MPKEKTDKANDTVLEVGTRIHKDFGEILREIKTKKTTKYEAAYSGFIKKPVKEISEQEDLFSAAHDKYRKYGPTLRSYRDGQVGRYQQKESVVKEIPHRDGALLCAYCGKVLIEGSALVRYDSIIQNPVIESHEHPISCPRCGKLTRYEKPQPRNESEFHYEAPAKIEPMIENNPEATTTTHHQVRWRCTKCNTTGVKWIKKNSIDKDVCPKCKEPGTLYKDLINIRGDCDSQSLWGLLRRKI